MYRRFGPPEDALTDGEDDSADPPLPSSWADRVVPPSVSTQLLDLPLDDARSALFTPEAWASLADGERQALRALLPPLGGDEAAQDAAVRRLFAGEALRWGSPLEACWAKLQAGALSEEALRKRAALELQRARENTALLREQHNSVVHRVHHLRRTWQPPEPTPPGPHRKGGQKNDGLFVYSKDGGGLVRAKGVPGRRVGSMYPTGAVVAGGGVPAASLSEAAAAAAAAAANAAAHAHASLGRLAPKGGASPDPAAAPTPIGNSCYGTLRLFSLTFTVSDM